MDKQEQKIDAFNKVKQVVDKHNLNISDKEISDWVNYESEVKPISIILARCSYEDNLKIINQQMNANFTLSTPLHEILNKISEK